VLPWGYITSLLHEGAQGIPEAVRDGEVIGDGRAFLNMPF